MKTCQGVNGVSKYTTEVRFICEHYAGLTTSGEYEDIDTIVSKAIPKIFNNFEIFDESYRNVLCSKILRHFYTREICAETVGLWKLWLNSRMNEIMPYYNRLYKSELLDFNPLYDVDVKKSYERSGNGTENTTDTFENGTTSSNESTSASNSTGKQTNTDSSENYNLYSNTPQGSLKGVDNGTYLTDARKIQDTNTSNTDTTNTNNTKTSGTSNTETSGTNKGDKKSTSMETYVETVTGKQGGENYSEMLQKFRETFLNIDMMIINDLSDLFLNLW